ncbi:VanW family protein [Natroniella sulfidigena]|uniref:VanW family protein n=1 Tax=Natroniella sulfidigena TaxID=723921 RepID=UPI00200ADF33|nr:VanW family protein [Natroniella sulfidigena]MCK8817298.1 VanW family protein [Natroniella sulfidigena]
MDLKDKARYIPILIALILISGLFTVLIRNNNLIDQSNEPPNDQANPPEQQQVNTGVTLQGEEISGKTKEELANIITQLAQKEKTKPKNSFIFKEVIISEQFGQKIDIPATIKRVLTAEPGTDVQFVTKKIPPTITAEKLKEKQYFEIEVEDEIITGKVLSNYTTYLENNQTNRRKNIELSLQEIDQYQLNKAEEFSFNQLVGSPTASKGYKEAPIIDSGEYSSAIGGGICQVSSTLYNAVDQAQLKVTEHHHHSKPVNYVPTGQDATVFPPVKDFRFVNNKESELMILTDLIDRYVVIYLIQLQKT